jgi:hypothetical protein
MNSDPNLSSSFLEWIIRFLSGEEIFAHEPDLQEDSYGDMAYEDDPLATLLRTRKGVVLLRDAIESELERRISAARNAGAKSWLWLRALSPSFPESPWMVTGSVRLGRSPDREIRLQANSVSRLHAEIRPDEHGWTVRDLGSRNGTWVNGRRLAGDAEVRLRAGAILQLSQVSLRAWLPDPTYPRVDGLGQVERLAADVLTHFDARNVVVYLAETAGSSLSCAALYPNSRGYLLSCRAVPPVAARVFSQGQPLLENARGELTWPHATLWLPLRTPENVRVGVLQITGVNPDPASSEATLSEADEQFGQALTDYDAFANPVTPPAIKLAWLWANDRAVQRVAESIRTERAFDALPILADALEDAGCTDRDILQHCQAGVGNHSERCWVLDLLDDCCERVPAVT